MAHHCTYCNQVLVAALPQLLLLHKQQVHLLQWESLCSQGCPWLIDVVYSWKSCACGCVGQYQAVGISCGQHNTTQCVTMSHQPLEASKNQYRLISRSIGASYRSKESSAHVHYDELYVCLQLAPHERQQSPAAAAGTPLGPLQGCQVRRFQQAGSLSS